MLLWSLIVFFLSLNSYGATITINSPANGASYPSTQTNITLSGVVSPGKGTTGTVVCTGNRTASFSNDTNWMRGFPLVNGTNNISCTYTNNGSSATASITVYRGSISPVADFSFTPNGGRAPKQINFDASASTDADGTITSYSWNFGDGATGSGAQVNHTFQTQGYYNVQLTVTDNTSLTSTITKSIQILEPNNPPVASFIAPATGKTGSQITFDGTGSSDSDGTINSYLWTFSDGGSGVTAIRNKSFSNAGVYTAELKVTDDKGDSSTIQKSITIVDNIAPNADFNLTPASGQVPLTVSVDGSLSTDTDGTISSYSWDFGDGTTATGITSGHTYTSSGNFLIKLTIVDNDGMPKSKTRQVTVTSNMKPVAGLSASTSYGVAPLGVNFDSTSSYDTDGGVQYYKMNFGDGSSEVVSGLPYISHTYIAVGTYTATLWVKDFAGQWSDPVTMSIQVNQPNLPPILGPNQNISMFEDGSLNFTVNNASDPESQDVTYHLVTGPAVGTLSGCLNGSTSTQCTYNPPPNFNGSVQIVYRVYDGVHYSSDNAEINITVSSVNDLPVIGEDQSFEGTEDVALNFTLNPSTDADGDFLTYSIVDSPVSGTLLGCLSMGGGLNCTFLPSSNFTGEINFTYKASDMLSDSLNVAVVTMNFTEVEDAPVLQSAESFIIQEDIATTINLAGGYDPEGGNLTYSAISFPDHGILKNCLGGSSDLTCEFVPEKDFNGTVTFSYKANDGLLDSLQSALVTISIQPVNDKPVAKEEILHSTELNTTKVINIAGAVDIDSSNITYMLISGPTGGTLENCMGGTSDLECDFIPSQGFLGETEFTYKANDGQLDSDPIVVKIFVNNVPEADFILSSSQGEAPFLVTFDGSPSSDTDGSISQYTWSFDDEEEITLSGKVVEYIFEKPGVYEMTLTVHDDFGSHNSVTKTITVLSKNQMPVADFITSDTYGPAPLMVDFDASISNDDGTIATFAWDFGDGVQGTGEQVNHTYTTPGLYTVTLTVTDNFGAINQKNEIIYISGAPCAGASGTFHENGGGFVSSTAEVDEDVYIGEGSEVCDQAKVKGDSRLEGKVKVSGNAQILDNSEIVGPEIHETGMLEVYGNAVVKGSSSAKGKVKIYDNAQIEGNSQIFDDSRVFGSAIVVDGLLSEYAQVYGNASVIGDPSQLNLDEKNISGNAKVYDDAKIVGGSRISGSSKVYGNAIIENSFVSEDAQVYGSSSVIKLNNVQSRIYGSAKVNQSASVKGSFVGGTSEVTDFCIISHDGVRPSQIYGSSKVKDFAQINGSDVYDSAMVFGSALISNGSKIHGTATVDYDVNNNDVSTK